MTGALMIGGESSENVAGALAAAKEHHLDAEFLDTEALRRRYRRHVVRAGDVAVLDRQAGSLNPDASVAALLAHVPHLASETDVRSVSDLRGRVYRLLVAA